MSVYKAINAVQAALSKTGISKDKKNSQGSGYMFRGIDDVYNAVAPLLSTHGLCILPRMMTRSMVPQTSKSGGNLFYVTVEAEFDLVASEDGSKHTIRTFGEAMDSGDKATNKAMSAAYKYALFQTFCIPTEGDNDADSSTHEVVAKKQIPAASPDLLKAALAAAHGGIGLYASFWKNLPAEARLSIGSSAHEDFKAIANEPKLPEPDLHDDAGNRDS